MEPESKVLGGTFDALDSIDSDQGPNLMNRMHLKCPRDCRRRHPPPIQVPLKPNESNDYDDSPDASTLSQVLALGPTFDPLDPLDSDQGPTLMHLINLKVLAFEGPTFDAFGPFDSGQGPNRMHLMNLKSWPWGRL